MSYPGCFKPIDQQDKLKTLTPAEARAWWAPEAVAERERNAPKPRE